ncbi:hypothetical protein ACFV0B_11315 [Streptomyces xanthophaeus]|uniref:hypothetical protein n=1 Tax=Streptomyces xanthophaeus TaxID=67385 RepID=UPI0036A84B13
MSHKPILTSPSLYEQGAPVVADLLLAAADRIEANLYLTATASVSAGFARGILTMTVRAELADLRDDVAGAERTELGSGLAADYYGRHYPNSRTHRDADRYANKTTTRATAARRSLREAEIAAEQNILAALAAVGPIAVGTTRGQLADAFRAAASHVRRPAMTS